MPFIPPMSEAEQVATVAARWRSQYFDTRGHCWAEIRVGSTEEIYKQLLALPSSATAADVGAIIGNDSWIGRNCQECKERRIGVWEIGEPEDYESHTVHLCTDCIQNLMDAVKAFGSSSSDV